MLKYIEDLCYRIRFGRVETIDEIRERLEKINVPMSKSGLENIFDLETGTDFSGETAYKKNPANSDNPYASPAELIERPINNILSYLRGVVIKEKPSGEVEVTGEYFKENCADHKFDGQWKPRVIYHEKVTITVRKVPGSGTIYSGKLPREMIRRFISDLPPEN